MFRVFIVSNQRITLTKVFKASQACLHFKLQIMFRSKISWNCRFCSKSFQGSSQQFALILLQTTCCLSLIDPISDRLFRLNVYFFLHSKEFNKALLNDALRRDKILYALNQHVVLSRDLNSSLIFFSLPSACFMRLMASSGHFESSLSIFFDLEREELSVSRTLATLYRNVASQCPFILL